MKELLNRYSFSNLLFRFSHSRYIFFEIPKLL